MSLRDPDAATDTLWQNARYALRTLRRDLGFTMLVGPTLGMGIGANMAVFTVVRAVLLEPLPHHRLRGRHPWLEGVGVVGDMRRQGPEREPIPQLFVPYAQAPSRNMVLLARTSGPMPGLPAAVRTTIAAIDRTVPLHRITTVTRAADQYLLQRRFQTLLLGLFSSIALVLAAIGIYGLVQYRVSQRTGEIGVRMALGGTPGEVVSRILRQALAVALPGLALGMVCALLLARGLSALLFGVVGYDLPNVALTSGILLLTALAACYVPARRAARVDPMAALRHRRPRQFAPTRGGGRGGVVARSLGVRYI